LPEILVDENVPTSVMQFLKKRGLTATRVSEANLKGAKDQTIAQYAAKHNITMLTLDTDFAQIYHALHKGTITAIGIRAKPAPPTNITEILEATLKKIKVEELRKKLAIITKNRIRIIA